MSENPKVTISIPSYSQVDYLTKALESIIVQDFKDYEVVITDDTPDDSVKDLVEKYKDKLPIRYIKNAERKRQAANWNESINQGRGEYVKILHHDDWFPEKDSLGKFVKLLDDNPDADFAFAASINYDSDGNVKYIHKIKDFEIKRLQDDPKNLLLVNVIGAPSATIYRKKIDSKFDPKLKWLIDMDFYIDAMQKSRKFIASQEPLIAILNEAADRVTAECIDNIEVEIPEYTYVYTKISKGHNIDYKRFRRMWHLYDYYNVTNAKMLTDLKIEDKDIRFELKMIPNLIAASRASKRLWNKFKIFISTDKWIGMLFFGVGYVISSIIGLFKKDN